MADRTCSIDGCEREYLARGLCRMHYKRAQRRGEFVTTRLPIEQRFWAKVDKSAGADGCWPWTAALNGAGYGSFCWRGRTRDAHRIAYELASGESLGEFQVDHKCWNHACCNPAHLRPVAKFENMQNRKGAARHSRTGIRGVTEAHRGDKVYWSARVHHRGKTHYLGRFKTPEAAGEAARLKRLELFTHNEADKQ